MYHVRIESAVDGRILEHDVDAMIIVLVNREHDDGIAMPDRVEFYGLTVDEARLIASLLADETMRPPDYFREL